MSRHETSSELSVQALLDNAKEVPRQSEAVRTRVLARARATAAVPLPVVSLAAPPPRFAPQLVAAAAGTALVGGIIGTVLALSGGSRHAPATPASPAAVRSQPTSAPIAVPSPAAPAASVAAVAESPPSTASAAQRVSRSTPRGGRAEGAQESYNAELELMRSAHTAYAAHDYTSALVLVGEHARRFSGGLLSEEREALRVRCLLGAGRRSQARLAADAFASRFPRSVLLHRLQSEVGAGAE